MKKAAVLLALLVPTLVLPAAGFEVRARNFANPRLGLPVVDDLGNPLVAGRSAIGTFPADFDFSQPVPAILDAFVPFGGSAPQPPFGPRPGLFQITGSASIPVSGPSDFADKPIYVVVGDDPTSVAAATEIVVFDSGQVFGREDAVGLGSQNVDLVDPSQVVVGSIFNEPVVVDGLFRFTSGVVLRPAVVESGFEVTIQNFTTTTAGLPVLDLAGAPLRGGTVAVGTFPPGFDFSQGRAEIFAAFLQFGDSIHEAPSTSSPGIFRRKITASIPFEGPSDFAGHQVYVVVGDDPSSLAAASEIVILDGAAVFGREDETGVGTQEVSITETSQVVVGTVVEEPVSSGQSTFPAGVAPVVTNPIGIYEVDYRNFLNPREGLPILDSDGNPIALGSAAVGTFPAGFDFGQPVAAILGGFIQFGEETSNPFLPGRAGLIQGSASGSIPMTGPSDFAGNPIYLVVGNDPDALNAATGIVVLDSGEVFGRENVLGLGSQAVTITDPSQVAAGSILNEPIIIDGLFQFPAGVLPVPAGPVAGFSVTVRNFSGTTTGLPVLTLQGSPLTRGTTAVGTFPPGFDFAQPSAAILDGFVQFGESFAQPSSDLRGLFRKTVTAPISFAGPSAFAGNPVYVVVGDDPASLASSSEIVVLGSSEVFGREGESGFGQQDVDFFDPSQVVVGTVLNEEVSIGSLTFPAAVAPVVTDPLDLYRVTFRSFTNPTQGFAILDESGALLEAGTSAIGTFPPGFDFNQPLADILDAFVQFGASIPLPTGGSLQGLINGIATDGIPEFGPSVFAGQAVYFLVGNDPAALADATTIAVIDSGEVFGRSNALGVGSQAVLLTDQSEVVFGSVVDGPIDLDGPFNLPAGISLQIPLIRGDMNADGAVDPNDVDLFVLALLDPEEFERQTGRSTRAGDMNGDGLVNGLDIDLFSLLVLGSTPVIGPSPPAAISSLSLPDDRELIQISWPQAASASVYEIEFSRDASNWTRITHGILLPDRAGTFIDTDPERVNGPSGYYRINRAQP